jgi:hypothetical protein
MFGEKPLDRRVHRADIGGLEHLDRQYVARLVEETLSHQGGDAAATNLAIKILDEIAKSEPINRDLIVESECKGQEASAAHLEQSSKNKSCLTK